MSLNGVHLPSEITLINVISIVIKIVIAITLVNAVNDSATVIPILYFTKCHTLTMTVITGALPD